MDPRTHANRSIAVALLLGAALAAAAPRTAPAAPRAVPAAPRAVGGEAAQSPSELDLLLARARAASGWEAFAKSGGALTCSGSARLFGCEATVTAILAADGRYLSRVDGPLTQRQGWDGATAWGSDLTGLATELRLGGREHLLLELALMTGGWCRPDGTAVATGITKADATTTTVALRARDGILVVELDVDAGSALPRTLRWHVAGALETWTLSDWREAAGLRLPGRFEIDDDGQRTWWTFEEATAGAAPEAAFALPAARPSDFSFDAGAPAALACRRAPAGHLIVKGEIDGEPVEGIVFDSGAAFGCIDPQFAESLALEPVGEILVGGAGAQRHRSRFWRGTSLTLGPVTIESPHFLELELDGFAPAFGPGVKAIVGWEVLQRSVARVDMTDAEIELFDPATFDAAGIAWRELVLHDNHPLVRCTFAHDGEQEGWFRLDTGAPGIAAIFHSPTVTRLELAASEVPLPLAALGGAGGAARARVRTLDWFELGGVPFHDTVVLLSEDSRGAFADPWCEGTLGGDLMGRFDLVFDYPRGRLGFVPRAGE